MSSCLPPGDPEVVEYARQFNSIMAWSLLPQFAYVGLTSWCAHTVASAPARRSPCVFAPWEVRDRRHHAAGDVCHVHHCGCECNLQLRLHLWLRLVWGPRVYRHWPRFVPGCHAACRCLTSSIFCLRVGSPLATVLSFCVQLTVFTLYAVVIRGSQRACPVGWRSFLTTVCRAGYHKDYWFGWSMQSISWGCPILTKS